MAPASAYTGAASARGGVRGPAGRSPNAPSSPRTLVAAPSPRAGEAHPRAKVTEAAVRAWRREAARTMRQRLKATGGLNARTGAPLASLLRGTGLFARLAREHRPPVTVAAVCMAVYGDTWADVPGALPRYTPPPAPTGRGAAKQRPGSSARGASAPRPRAAKRRPQ